MPIHKESLALNLVLLRLALLRLFLPLLVITIIAIGGAGYLGKQSIEIQQRQKAQSEAQMVDRYLDQAGRIVDAIARVAEVSAPKDLGVYLKSTWKAYGYFDTIYYVYANSIKLLVPYDPIYLGLDTSNMPYSYLAKEGNRLMISRPFISLRTGNPTVYLVRRLSPGRYIVGELDLGLLQDEIRREQGRADAAYYFIVDQYGTLIAHPSSDLVRQQANLGYLAILSHGSRSDATLVYEYEGMRVLGSAARVRRTGWVVVAQIPLAAALGPYLLTMVLTLLASVLVWLGLVWNLRSQLRRHVVTPLEQLSQGAAALAIGDYSRVAALTAIPTTFAELDRLVTDFLHMGSTLQARQAALQKSEEQYRSLVENINVGVYRSTSDLPGRLLQANPAMLQIFGFPSMEEFLGISPSDLFRNSEDRQAYLAEIVQVGYLKGRELALRKRDGTPILCSCTANAKRDEKGGIEWIDGVVEDITERRRGEEERRQLEERLEAQKRLFYRESILSVTDGKLEICDQSDIDRYTSTALLTIDANTMPCIPVARGEVKRFCEESGLSGERLGTFLDGVGEAVANAVKHGRYGIVYCGCTDTAVWVAVADKGTGMESLVLPRATLGRGFSTKRSMGLGYTIIMSSADHVLLNTGPNGTTVLMIMNLVEPIIEMSIDRLPDTWE